MKAKTVRTMEELMKSVYLEEFMKNVTQKSKHIERTVSIYFRSSDNFAENKSRWNQIQKKISPDVNEQSFEDAMAKYRLTELRQVTSAIFVVGEDVLVYTSPHLEIDNDEVTVGSTPQLERLEALSVKFPTSLVLDVDYESITVFFVDDRGIEDITEEFGDLTLQSYLGSEFRIGKSNHVSVGNKAVAVHGHNPAKEIKKNDQIRFYQGASPDIVRFIDDNYKGIPVILGGASQNISTFSDAVGKNLLQKLNDKKIDGHFNAKNEIYEAYQNLF